MNQEQNQSLPTELPAHLQYCFQGKRGAQNPQQKHSDDIILNNWFSSLKKCSHDTEQIAEQNDTNENPGKIQRHNVEGQELRGNGSLNEKEINVPNIQGLTQQIKNQLPETSNLQKQKLLSFVPIINSDGEFPRFLDKCQQTFEQKVKVYENFVKPTANFSETLAINPNLKNNPYDTNKFQQKGLTISPQKTNILKPSNSKSKNQLHKKIDVFLCENSVPNIICPQSHLQNLQNFKENSDQADKITSKTILFLDSFQFKKRTQNQKVEFTIVQNYEKTVFIGQFDNGCTYKVKRRILLQSKIICCYADGQKGKLLIGCTNGFVYIIQKSELIDGSNSQQMEIKQKNIINVWNKKEIKEVTHILPHLHHKNIIYFVAGSTQVKTYFIKQHSQDEQQNNMESDQSENCIPTLQKQSQISQNYAFIEQDQKSIQNSIKVLKIISLPNSLTGLKQGSIHKKGMIIYINSMPTPCILDSSEVQYWFPQRIDQLVIAFNKEWRQFNFLQTSSSSLEDEQSSFSLSQDEIKDQDIAIPNIKIIDYGTKYNKVVIGTNNGTVIFGQIVRTEYCWPNQPQQKQESIILSNENDILISQPEVKECQSSEQECKQKQSQNETIEKIQKPLTQSLSKNVNKENFQQQSPISKNKFKYFFEQQFAFQQGTRVNSLQILNYEAYTCIATNTKIIFYDILERKKYSQGLKQKSTSEINLVKWTSNGPLLLCSIYGPEGRVYAYTKELPIRKETTDQL